MSDVPANEPNDAFDELVSHVELEFSQNANQRARMMLVEFLEESGGALSEQQAALVAAVASRDIRTVWRWRARHLDDKQAAVLTSAPPSVVAPPATTTDVPVGVLEALIAGGSGEFEFDDVMISLMYMVNGSQSDLRRLLLVEGIPMPSLATISRKWRQVHPLQRDGAKHGVLNKANKLLYVRHSADAPNDAWQFDAFNLDIFVRTKYGTTPIRPTALLLIDDHSRFIVSWVLMAHAMRSADVLAALGAGFEIRPDDRNPGVLVGGLPDLAGRSVHELRGPRPRSRPPHGRPEDPPPQPGRNPARTRSPRTRPGDPSTGRSRRRRSTQQTIEGLLS